MTKYRPLAPNGVYVPPSLTPPWWLTGLTWVAGMLGGFLMIVGVPALVVLVLVALGAK